MRGKFITLEGPDGSGKSTMLKLIEEYLKDNKIDYITSREPGGTKIGEDIRKIILDVDNKNMSNETEALLYAASRAQHVSEKILPAIEEGKLVLCDRFLLSSLAYQGVGRDLGIDEVKLINDFGTKGLVPDLILFFHVNPEVTLMRKTKNLGGDRLEQEGVNFHNKVYNGYMELLDKYPENIELIDATKPIDQVLEQALSKIQKII
ncbi:MAG TPA: dTMP kinase [Tissierellaceae bacterium]